MIVVVMVAGTVQVTLVVAVFVMLISGVALVRVSSHLTHTASFTLDRVAVSHDCTFPAEYLDSCGVPGIVLFRVRDVKLYTNRILTHWSENSSVDV
ncbi:hypothetical protein E2C01_046522 [Portunus trituberculatus]|uniref:Uncharacterized protein n=1 Tax=Portunus trituberculatus TaxID=210409 RepID=A0A5B7G530_PORTR|nr:hypothetical protein [Portunus trituberculatus]